MIRFDVFRTAVLSVLAAAGVACTADVITPGGNQAGADRGGQADGGFSNGDAGGGGEPCPERHLFLEVASAPGAGANYPAPSLSVTCEADDFVVTSNTIPHFTYVSRSPLPLMAMESTWRIPRSPRRAPAVSSLPNTGEIGLAVDGLPLFGPEESGDPIHEGALDECFGHTASGYHFHAASEKCLSESGLVAEPWRNGDPPATEASPILGFGFDGFAVFGPRECQDESCAQVIEMKSSWERTAGGDPATNAWAAYQYVEKNGPEWLDRCNGHIGPTGDYHYHATSGFPYLLGCYVGTPRTQGGSMMGGMDGGMMMMPPPMGDGGMMMPPPRDGGMMPPPMGDGGMMMGPVSCSSDNECTNQCPPGSAGCACRNTPMGMLCIPTCSMDSDCPTTPMGQLRCDQMGGFCRP